MLSTVRNAISVINCFTMDAMELSLAEIARELGINKSTVHHLVKTLAEEGVLVKNENNLYTLGNKVFEWGSIVSIRNHLVSLSIPFIHELVNHTKEVVHMGILDGGQVIYIAKSGLHTSISIGTQIGGRMAAHCTAVGKMLLAHEEEGKLERFFQKGLLKKTRNTITDPSKLTEELKKVREMEVAYDEGECTQGIHCISTKITNIAGDCTAAISVCGGQSGIQRNQADNIRYLRHAAASISKAVNDRQLRYLIDNRHLKRNIAGG